MNLSFCQDQPTIIGISHCPPGVEKVVTVVESLTVLTDVSPCGVVDLTPGVVDYEPRGVVTNDTDPVTAT